MMENELEINYGNIARCNVPFPSEYNVMEGLIFQYITRCLDDLK